MLKIKTKKKEQDVPEEAPKQEAEPIEEEAEETPEIEAAEEPEEEEYSEPAEVAPDIILPKALVVYMTSDLGPFECQNCCYFRKDGSCQIVEGDIDPLGCCNLYCPPDHDEPDGSYAHEMSETPEEEALEHATGIEAQDEDA